MGTESAAMNMTEGSSDNRTAQREAVAWSAHVPLRATPEAFPTFPRVPVPRFVHLLAGTSALSVLKDATIMWHHRGTDP